MDWTAFITALLSTQTPWLPDPVLLRWGQRVSWAFVLVGVALWFGRRGSRSVQWGLAGLLLLWTLLPGAVSPAFWLGLAFQAPSLMTALLCLVWVGTRLMPGWAWLPDRAPRRVLWPLAWAGIALGWLLLLDTFAVLPFQLYAFGFSPAAVAGAALAASLPWVVFGAQACARRVSMLLGAVLLLYVLLRLPSGNLWDALIDPWLWIALQMGWLARGVRRLSALWRGPQATRA